MREIKFRAWEKKGNGMVFLAGFYFKKPHRIKVYYADMNVQCWNIWDMPDDVILEQYTGIKDKRGKEIYEGDVTKDGVGNIDEIVWHPAGYFAIKRGDDFAFIDGSRIEIIGHIHEDLDIIKNRCA